MRKRAGRGDGGTVGVGSFSRDATGPRRAVAASAGDAVIDDAFSSAGTPPPRPGQWPRRCFSRGLPRFARPGECPPSVIDDACRRAGG